MSSSRCTRTPNRLLSSGLVRWSTESCVFHCCSLHLISKGSTGKWQQYVSPWHPKNITILLWKWGWCRTAKLWTLPSVKELWLESHLALYCTAPAEENPTQQHVTIFKDLFLTVWEMGWWESCWCHGFLSNPLQKRMELDFGGGGKTKWQNYFAKSGFCASSSHWKAQFQHLLRLLIFFRFTVPKSVRCFQLSEACCARLVCFEYVSRHMRGVQGSV